MAALRSNYWPQLAAFALGIQLAAVSITVSQAVAQTSDEWQASEWHLWRIDPDGSNVRPFCTCTGYRCGSPVWSPDGKFVACDAWLANQNSSDAQIIVISADGSNFHPIGPGGIPSWSRDSKLLLANHRGTFMMNADGTGREKVSVARSFPRWSRCDDRIVSLNMDTILVFDLVTGRDQQFRFRPISPASPSIPHGWDISPDGRQICFGTYGSGLQLATFDKTATNVSVRTLVNSGTALHTSWAPDGRHVVFAWQPTPQSAIQLYTIDVDSTDPPTLLPGLDMSHANVNPAWSPDGKTIIFSIPAPLSTSP